MKYAEADTATGRNLTEADVGTHDEATHGIMRELMMGTPTAGGFQCFRSFQFSTF